ncbi:MAG: DUF4430 domain-containing protein [Lachnospiraceae bacterium]|nr:DUF4430 domain-containing protein [Lachnospiraceae bacterium]
MTENRFIRRIWSVLVCFVLITAMTLTSTACQDKKETDNNAKVETSVDNQNSKNEAEEGKTAYTLIVIDKDGVETSFSLKTDEKTVGAALLKEGLIEGEESQYGLYVKKVNGILADYDIDQTYWAFYINGEYAMTGVDATNIEANATYTLKVEK